MEPTPTADTATAKGTDRSDMVAESGMGKLTKMLDDHMEMMQKKEEIVDGFIAQYSNTTLMKDAKVKAVETESRILKSIMNVMDMAEFLNNIILIENKFNDIYKPHKKAQEDARAKYAPDIAKYENKPKVNSECDSFVELMFGAQTVHIGTFHNSIFYISTSVPSDFSVPSKCNLCTSSIYIFNMKQVHFKSG